MQGQAASGQIEDVPQGAVRLHYLDWLRVLATLGVFFFHVINVFGPARFEINNAERSDAIMAIQGFFYPWGMPLFFLVSGAGSWFALRRRTAGQFTRERTLRILVPFFTGTLLLGPVQLYLSWSHKSQTGAFPGSFPDFLVNRLPRVSPKYLGAFGYHMWFLGFLFAYALLALPLFTWFKGQAGREFTSRLAGLCERRGAILLFILPVALVRLGLQPFFPQLQDWADFFSYGIFFVSGFVLYADERFTRAIRRDWGFLLGVAVVATLASMVIVVSLESFDVERAPGTFLEFVLWGLIAASAWCSTAFVLFIGMRYLDRDSRTLRYGQETLLPFFLVHQPAILAVAYFVVQWEAGITIKLLIVLFGAFALSIAVVELVIKRIGLLRLLFGMKERPKAAVVQPQGTAPGSPLDTLPSA